MFETYYNNLMAMKKMDIIKEGIAWASSLTTKARSTL